MRAVRWMAWVLAVLVCVAAGLTWGCSSLTYLDEEMPALEEPDPGELEDPPDADCVCKPKPLAPFNPDLHLVWIGDPRNAKECAEIDRLPGFEGEVVSVGADRGFPAVKPGDRVRECLITTLADPCGDGQLCAPPPPPDYRLCITREIDGVCPPPYYPQHVVARQDGTPTETPATLFCCTTPEPVP